MTINTIILPPLVTSNHTDSECMQVALSQHKFKYCRRPVHNPTRNSQETSSRTSSLKPTYEPVGPGTSWVIKSIWKAMDLKIFGRRTEVEQVEVSSRGDVKIWKNKNEPSILVNPKVLQQQLPDVYEWLRLRLDRSYTVSDLTRLGLLEGKVQGGGDEKEYDIKRVFLASKWEEGLREGQYYGSDMTRGGLHTFWPIVFHSIKSHAIHTDALPGSPIMSDLEEDHENPSKPTIEIVYSPSRKAAFLDALDAWCTKNPGKFFKLWYPGHRKQSMLAPKFLMKDRAIFCTATEGDCLRAALGNALNSLEGSEPATRMLRAGPINGNSIGRCARWLEQTMGIYRLVKVKVPPSIELERWLLSEKEGIFIVIVEGVDREHDTIQHAVCADLKQGLIFDCIERYAMRLLPGVFDVCVGDGCEFIGVSDKRELKKQNIGSRHGNSRRMKPTLRRYRKEQKTKTEGAGPSNIRSSKKRKIVQE